MTSKSLPTAIAELPMDGKPMKALIVTTDGVPVGRTLFPFEVIGVFDQDSPPPHDGPEAFRQNGTFLHFLNWVISLEVPLLPGAQAAARQIGSGLLQVLDGRASERRDQEHAAEDILGHFEVEQGQVLPGSYEPSFTHKALSDKGLFKLDEVLCQKILERISAQVVHELAKSGRLNG